jgi:hypothetical protein
MIYLGHFNNYPYGVAPRTSTGFVSSTSLRPPSDAPQNPPTNDPYTAFAIAQDPMLGM